MLRSLKLIESFGRVHSNRVLKRLRGPPKRGAIKGVEGSIPPLRWEPSTVSLTPSGFILPAESAASDVPFKVRMSWPWFAAMSLNTLPVLSFAPGCPH